MMLAEVEQIYPMSKLVDETIQEHRKTQKKDPKSDLWNRWLRTIRLLKGSRKKMIFWGKFPQMCEPTHPPQGLCEIWENKTWNSGQKFRFSGWFRGEFGPCLGISNPTNPYLGKLSQITRFFKALLKGEPRLHLSSTYIRPSVVHNTFWFSFCQRLWAYETSQSV